MTCRLVEKARPVHDAPAFWIFCGVDQLPDPREGDCPRTHGARLQRHKEPETREPVIAPVHACLTDCDNLCMRRRIMDPDGAVTPFGDHFIGARVHDHGADRDLAIGSRLARKLKCSRHMSRVWRHAFAHTAARAFRHPCMMLSASAMRIISGKFKGQAITAPAGRDTRPTSDRARESLFNVLAHASWAPDLEGARVIDLFAGSGALGFEAISRGAAFCLFVETESAARGAIRNNIESFQLFGNTRIHRRSATDLGAKPAGVGEPFTLAFMDPPYNKGLVEPCLATLRTGDWLAPDALVVVETEARETFEHPGFTKVDTREAGKAKITMLRFDA